jgi:hypothetical protein
MIAYNNCIKAFSYLQGLFISSQVPGHHSTACLCLLRNFKTHWNSTCQMLICTVRLQKAINALIDGREYYYCLWHLQHDDKNLEMAKNSVKYTLQYALKEH